MPRPKPEVLELKLSQIDPSPAFAVRAAPCEEDFAKYAEDMKAGDKFPPVKVYTGGQGHYLLGDGGTRYRACEIAGFEFIAAELHVCDSEDEAEDEAAKCAAGSNENHGRRRSNEDRRAAVASIMKRAKYEESPDREIAKLCKVHHPLVRLVREKLTAEGKLKGKAKSTERDYKEDSHIRGGMTSDGKGNVVPRKASAKQLEFPPVEQTAMDIAPYYPPVDIPLEIELIPDEEPTGRATTTALKDGKKRDVPDRLTVVFSQRFAFDNAVINLKSSVKAIQDRSAEPAFASISWNNVQADLDNLTGDITSAAPFVVCPACDGTGQKLPAGPKRPACGTCTGRGWISRGGWTRLSDDQKEVASGYTQQEAA